MKRFHFFSPGANYLLNHESFSSDINKEKHSVDTGKAFHETYHFEILKTHSGLNITNQTTQWPTRLYL